MQRKCQTKADHTGAPGQAGLGGHGGAEELQPEREEAEHRRDQHHQRRCLHTGQSALSSCQIHR